MSTRPCEICGQEIDPERAEVLPETTLCTEHAREIAKYGGEFIIKGKQANIGKAGSLKKNYGDVNVVKRRNQSGVEKLRQEYLAKNR